jgi:hypothetical protein
MNNTSSSTITNALIEVQTTAAKTSLMDLMNSGYIQNSLISTHGFVKPEIPWRQAFIKDASNDDIRLYNVLNRHEYEQNIFNKVSFFFQLFVMISILVLIILIFKKFIKKSRLNSISNGSNLSAQVQIESAHV